MKSISIFLVSCLTALTIYAQSSVMITVQGNSTRQVVLDGRKYTISNETNNQKNLASVTITGLQSGQHNLKVIRQDAFENVNNNITTFNLRSDYDMQITVNTNSSVQLREVQRRTVNSNRFKIPMPDASFNSLYEDIRGQRSSNLRMQRVSEAFAQTSNYFSSAQTRQLLQLVRSENSRFEQAKASYRNITDPVNFSLVHDQLISKAHRDRLTAYVKEYDAKNPAYTSNIAMSDASFNTIYMDVQRQSATNARVNFLSNAFTDRNNYFLVSQAQQMIQLVTGESNRLYLAKISYPTIVDPENFSKLYTLFSSPASRNELELYVINNGSDPVYNYPIGMSDANFNNLYKEIQNQWPVSSQVNSLTNAFNTTNNYFSTYQASQLIQLVNSESTRLQLAKLSYRAIIDQTNFYQIYNLLNTQAGRDELAAFVKNNYNYNPKVAMSAENFNTLYQEMKLKWPASKQMSSLANEFNTANNYFSTYQASQLIQLVAAENNRLELAKLSYRSITDPADFIQIYNLLSSQASRDELAAFVKNNNYTERIAMLDANFLKLYQDIKSQWPVSTQVNLLTNAFNNTSNYFSTYQASQLIQLVAAESTRLQLAKLSYRTIIDPTNFYQIYNLLNTQDSRDELAAFVNSNNNNPKVAMLEANFNNLFNDIRSQWPVSTQVNSLTNAFNYTNNFFTTSQAIQLIQLVISETSRLQLAKLSFKNIADPSNFSQVYNVLNSQASKDELAAFVNNNSYNPKVAMPDANFNSLYQSIQAQFFPSEQMKTLTIVFNNTSNFFTTAQAKQLIPLVSYESNRLTLAKLSYRSIVDRNNFDQLYVLLNNQASRNELDAYAKAYKD